MRTIKKQDLPENMCNPANREHRKRLKQSNRARDIQKIVSSVAILLCFAFILWGGFKIFADNAYAYNLIVDGKQVATLTSEQEAKDAIDKCLASESAELGLTGATYKENIEIKEASTDGAVYITSDDAAKLLADKITIMVNATILQVDGKSAVAVADEATAKKAVEEAKQYYINDGDKVLDVKLREKITTATQLRSPNDICSLQEATNVLLFGSKGANVHEVESSDETMWTIANQYGISMHNLKVANPGLTSDKITPGMKINLAAAAPKITVVVVKEVVVTASIPFSVEKKSNSSMLRGTSKTISQGVNGQEQVTLKVAVSNGQEINRQRISSVVTKAAVAKVVERGTKMVVASRGSGGSGSLSWPVYGSITSRFGGRSRGYHTGVDIDGSTGDSIRAAESGKVIFAGREGGYGNLIKLDNGDGLQTWYGHLSKISVSVGESVEKGEVIGKMGSTGNSTGSHLHFEVRINGTPYNPLKYLN